LPGGIVQRHRPARNRIDENMPISSLRGKGIRGARKHRIVAVNAGPANAFDRPPPRSRLEGDYVNHGVLLIEATPGSAGQFTVTGTLDISGATLTLDLSPASPAAWTVSGPFVIIDNRGAGAITGTFAAIDNPFVFLDETLDYAGGDNNDVTLTLARNSTAFSGFARTRNQVSVAEAVDALGDGSAVWNAVALSGSADGARHAFDVLSGEIHASARSGLLADATLLERAILGRLRSALDTRLGGAGMVEAPLGYAASDEARSQFPSDAFTEPALPVAIWMQALGASGEIGSDANAMGLDRQTAGLILGADMAIGESWRLGAFAGYGRSGFDIGDLASSAASENYHLGLYAGNEQGPMKLRLGAAYSAHDLEARRSVDLMSETLVANHGAATAQAFGEIAYQTDIGAVRLEPFAGLAYVNLHTQGFVEMGGDAALTTTGSTDEVYYSTLGLRAVTSFPVGEASATLSVMLGWRHAFGDVMPLASHAFRGGGSFVIAGVPIAQDTILAELGLDLTLSSTLTLGTAYAARYGEGTSEQDVRGNLRRKF
jgi:outer membrane autotransporter protein